MDESAPALPFWANQDSPTFNEQFKGAASLTFKAYCSFTETLNNLSYNKGAALAATGEILYDGGVWVTEGDGDTLVFIDGTGDVTATRYTKQACIPAMGKLKYHS